MTKKRVVYFDALNIIAAFSVGCLHQNGLAHTFVNNLAWKQAMAVEVVCYWAVPIFLMLSGATLMGYREKYSTKDFFKKRFLRTLVPFLVWSLIAATYNSVNLFDIEFKEFIEMLFFTKFMGVYWFFIPLFAVYIAMPILSLLKDNKEILWYMAGGAFLLNTFLPSIFKFCGIAWNGSLSMLTVSGYLVLPIIGYLFATTDFKKHQRVIIYILGVFGAALRYFGTYFLSVRDGALNKTFFDGYASYHSIFLACAVFTFFKYSPLINNKFTFSEKGQKLLKTVSSCSLGVYLIHIFVKMELAKVITPNCWEWRILVPFLVYGISLLTVYLIKKIPIIKNIVP